MRGFEEKIAGTVNKPIIQKMVDFSVIAAHYDDLETEALKIANEFFGPTYSVTVAERHRPRPCVDPETQKENRLYGNYSDNWIAGFTAYANKKRPKDELHS